MSKENKPSKFELLAISVVGGSLLAFILIAFVFLTGQTFGQKCARIYEQNSQQWYECVHTLANGENYEYDKNK